MLAFTKFAFTKFVLRRVSAARFCGIAMIVFVAAGFVREAIAQQAGPERWKSAIEAFEKADATMPPAKNANLFVGSSSIRMWKLDDSFPDLSVINRGFGGSQIEDSVHYIEQLVLKHEPRVVVLYAGDNDIGSGKSPERVLADYQAFVDAVHKSLPKTRIAFIAIKPSLKRWSLIDKIRDANQRIEAVTKTDDRLEFIDVDAPMLDSDGKPRGELFQKDGLHLSDEGYRLWASLVRPHLK
ncbi:MAG: hypothetical protein KDA38_03170 [Planctomycetales bacterium]|nr:hypothetical protein [Planctomycetales bacterium]MCA9226560.1 hypothetical protein [Planctomycetales bacterium]